MSNTFLEKTIIERFDSKAESHPLEAVFAIGVEIQGAREESP